MNQGMEKVPDTAQERGTNWKFPHPVEEVTQTDGKYEVGGEKIIFSGGKSVLVRNAAGTCGVRE